MFLFLCSLSVVLCPCNLKPTITDKRDVFDQNCGPANISEVNNQTFITWDFAVRLFVLNAFFITVTHCLHLLSSVKRVALYKHLSRLKLIDHSCGNVVPIESAPWNLSAGATVAQERDDWSVHDTSKERTSDNTRVFVPWKRRRTQLSRHILSEIDTSDLRNVAFTVE